MKSDAPSGKHLSGVCELPGLLQNRRLGQLRKVFNPAAERDFKKQFISTSVYRVRKNEQMRLLSRAKLVKESERWKAGSNAWFLLTP